MTSNQRAELERRTMKALEENNLGANSYMFQRGQVLELMIKETSRRIEERMDGELVSTGIQLLTTELALLLAAR